MQSAVRIQNGGNFIIAGWGATNPQFIISSDGGTSGVSCGSDISIENNIWHHLAFVWKKSTTFATYLDGVLQNSRVAANVNLPTFSGTTMRLGSYLGTGEFLKGNLDDVRIWNVARIASEISSERNCELQGTESGLLAYYKFNQGVGAATNSAITTLTDAVAGGTAGTLNSFALTGTTTSNWLAGSPVASGITCASLGTSSFDIPSFSVYPNPTTGIFNVNANEIMQLQLYDFLGKNILNQNVQVGASTVNISTLPTGVYVLKATNSQGKTNSYKVVKM